MIPYNFNIHKLSYLGQKFDQKIRELQELKKKAVDKMEFEKAIKFKNNIEQLTKMEIQFQSQVEKDEKAERGWDDETSELFDNLIEYLDSESLTNDDVNLILFNINQNKILQQSTSNKKKQSLRKERQQLQEFEHGSLSKKEQANYLMSFQQEQQKLQIYQNVREVEITDDMILEEKVLYLNPKPDDEIVITGVFKDNLGQKFIKQFSNNEDDFKMNKSTYNSEKNQMKKQYFKSITNLLDQQELPSMKNFKEKQYFEIDANENLIPVTKVSGIEGASIVAINPNELNSYERQIFFKIEECFGFIQAQTAFAGRWQTRLKLYQTTQELFTDIKKSKNFQSIEKIQLFLSLINLVNKGLDDSVQQVYLEAIKLFSNALKGPYFNKFNKIEKKEHQQEYGTVINLLINNLFSKMGSSNLNVKEESNSCLMQMSFHPIIGYEMILQRIYSVDKVKKSMLVDDDDYKYEGYSNHQNIKNMTQSLKHLIARIQLASQIIESHPIESNKYDLNQLVQYCIQNVHNSNANVRQQAYILMLQVYKQIGKKMIVHVSDMKPVQTEIFNNACKMIDNGNLTQAFDYINQQTLQSDIIGAPILVGSDKKNQPIIVNKAGLSISYERGPDGKYPVISTCEYCKKQDSYFKESAIYLNHIKNKCPALKNCQYCKERIKINEERNHLMSHCKSGLRKSCYRCDELFIFPNEYADHIEKVAAKSKCLQKK